MNKRVLFVDDEPNVLQAIKRAIRKEVDVTIAVGPEEGLKILSEEPTFAIIVSDMRMPGMNGIEFLRAATQLSPDSVRVMLTGNSDQQTAVGAVNDGQVFRFLTKPCDVTLLRHVLSQGLRQFELVNAERDLLDNTVKGSLSMMTDLLSMAMPEAFGRTCRLKDKVMTVAARNPALSAEELWSIETAAMLSQLGMLTLDPHIVQKINSGEELDHEEQKEYVEASIHIADMIDRVPRMEAVARIVQYQHKHYAGGGYPEDDVKAEAIPFGARALHLALGLDALYLKGETLQDTITHLSRQRDRFDPRMLEQLGKGHVVEQANAMRKVAVNALAAGMRIEQDVFTDGGTLLVCAGQTVTDSIFRHLKAFISKGTLTGEVMVSGIESAERPMRQTA